MARLVPGKQTAVREDGIVVFLIGARIHRWWLLPLALPIIARMPAMIRELTADPALGLLGVQPLGLGGMVQYWRSLDHLLAYAEAPDHVHRPTARAFFRKVFRNEAVGVWHETYVVPAGSYETLYVNMPRFGLGTCSELAPAVGERGTSRQRLGLRRSTPAPDMEAVAAPGTEAVTAPGAPGSKRRPLG